MNTTMTTATNLRQQIDEKIESLSVEQLAALLKLLEDGSLFDREQPITGSSHRNGRVLQGKKAEYFVHPWMEYVDQLKDSPNWDEYLQDLAEIRREANEEYAVE